MSETTPIQRIVDLQHAIEDALPEVSRHLVGELGEEWICEQTGSVDRLLHALKAHLPHLAVSIQQAADHILAGDADPTLATCCKR